MAHSSFIDCEVGNSLTENFIAEAALKVEIETQQVNDDENVAVEVLGQLGGNYESCSEDMTPLIPIKTEENEECEENSFTYVHEVQVENCIEDEEPILVQQGHPISHNIPLPTPNINDVNTQQPDMNNYNSDHEEKPVINDDNNVFITCSICGLKLKDEMQLQNHVMTTHNMNTLDRPYKCDFCAMAFHRKSSLKNHLKIHTYGILPVYEKDNVAEVPADNNDNTINNKQKVDKKRNSNNRKSNNNKKNTSQNRIPPFETLKPNTATNSNYPTNMENDLFAGWSPNEARSDTNYLKPIPESNQNSVNNIIQQQQQPFPSDSKEKPYTCPFCNRTFAREKALLNHIRIHNDNYDMTLECQKCHDIFDDIISLQAHLVACVLPESAAIEHHSAPESPEYVSPYDRKRYTCTFNQNNNTTVTGAENQNYGDHVCNICNKRFKTRQKVFRHMWVHRRKMYNCEVCGLPFPAVKYLDEHRIAIHPSKAPFSCSTCGKSFMSKQGLTEHSRLHKGWSEQYYCNYCEKFFSSRQGFTIHGRIHTNERPYGCKYCPKSFRDGGTLKKHERIHTGERPHECPLCHKRYNQKVVLREHIRAVHVMKKNSDINGKCPVCGIQDMDKEELSEHMVRHSDELMKKVKQEFQLKQKTLEKFDKAVGNSRKRRNRILKNVNMKTETEDKEDYNNVPTGNDTDYIYPYKIAIPPRSNKRRTTVRRRALDKKNNVTTMAGVNNIKSNNNNNQKKKLVENKYEPPAKKPAPSNNTKRSLKHSTKRHLNKLNNSFIGLSNEDHMLNQNIPHNSHFIVDETNSETSVSNHNYDMEMNSKKCLSDYADDIQPLKLLECEMCHARFPTRSELITHVLVHI